MADAPSRLIDERAFHPNFLATCSDLDLVRLQHDLRQFPEDRPYLHQVLMELKRRQEKANG